MIGLFDDSGNRLSLAWDGLSLNVKTANDDMIEVDTALMTGQYDTSLDSRPADDGSELASVRRSLYVLRMDGILRAPTLAKLYDQKALLAQKFDPARLFLDNPTTFGALPLTFSVPTLDTTNYPTGLVSSFYTCRPRAAVLPPDSVFTGRACRFSIELLMADPRRYFATQQSKTNSGACDNTLATYPSWPSTAVTMSGAGSATYQIARAHGTFGTKTLVLNLSGRSNGQIVTIDHEHKRILVNGVETDGIYVSGDYWRMDVGTNTLTITNTTGVSSSITTWYRAFVA